MSRKPTRHVVMARCTHGAYKAITPFYVYQDPDKDSTRQVFIEKIPHEYKDGDILVIEKTKTQHGSAYFLWRIVDDE